MTYPVTVTLYSKHILYGGYVARNEAPIPEETTERFSGTMSITENKIQFDFYSRADFGETQEHTVVTAENNSAVISRIGYYELNMAFVKDEACSCIYTDGTRQMSVRIKTKKFENTLNCHGGELHINYSVEVYGSVAEVNDLFFTVALA